jgi:hypothetical protein|eukprot:COSAG01_NODE_709_length_14119_cov_107.401213_15_plen_159_part_00
MSAILTCRRPPRALLVIKSPWLQFTSECQRFGPPPRLNNAVAGGQPRRTHPQNTRNRQRTPTTTGAGADNGMDHDQNGLRFPYDSTLLRSHYLHPPPYRNWYVNLSQSYLLVDGEQHVAGLDVAVHDPERVQELNAGGTPADTRKQSIVTIRLDSTLD